MALERELQTYRNELPRLLPHSAGKYVLIHEDQVAGAYDTYQDAIKEGYSKFKLEPFLVKQIEAVEQAQYIMRHLCHT